MNIDEFSLQLTVWRVHLAQLLERTNESESPQALLLETIEELNIALEEMTVAYEEIRQQYQILAKTQMLVEQERHRYQEIFEFAQDGLLLTDQNGMIREANRAAAMLLNVTQKFLIGKPLISFIPMAQRYSFRSHLTSLQRQDKLLEWEVSLQPHQREPIDVVIIMASVREPTGKLIALRWLIRDLTEIKQVEKEHAQLLLREQQARIEAEAAQVSINNILETITDAFVSLDTQWRYTYVNTQAERLLGKSASELIGGNVWEVFPDTVNSQSYTLFHQALAQQVSLTYEEFFPLFDKWFAIRLYPSPNGLSVYFLDITTHQITQETLQQQAFELAQANRIKDQFLTIVSHELRSPLSVILGWTQTLQNGSLNATITTRAIETIERSTRSQIQLIENLLDISQIITGKLQINFVSIALAPIIEAAINAIRIEANAKQIQIHSKLDATVGGVLGDPKRLQQIMWHLLSNAIKFTPQGGRIEVLLSQSEDAGTGEVVTENNSQFLLPSALCPLPSAQITVRDTGIGITSEFIPFVFESFCQADSTITRSYSGMGVGLAIVRHLVEMHGGTVCVVSPGKEQGTTFTVKLPCSSNISK